MKSKLYSNTKRLTTLFFGCILCVTLASLALRLTVFSDMATEGATDIIKSGGSKASGSDMADGSGTDIAYQVNRKIYFSRPDAKGNVYIRNPESNEYYLKVDIVLADTGKSLVYTGFIKPGVPYDSAKLSIQLEEGEYDCIAQIAAVDPDTQLTISTVEEQVKVYVGVKPD